MSDEASVCLMRRVSVAGAFVVSVVCLRLHCLFRALWYIKTLVPPANAQLYDLRILSVM